MSWGSRIGLWSGRFSPFGRSHTDGAPQVNDDDFSYITSDDLKRSDAESRHPTDNGPPRDTDCIVLKSKRVSYPAHFPAYSIGNGELTVGAVREQAAKKTGSDARRIKLLYKGKTLKDDTRSCRGEGLREGSEVMCVIGDALPDTSSGSDSEDDSMGGADGGLGEGDTPKRKRNRNRKKKKGKKTGGTSTPSDSIPTPSVDTSRAASPRPPPPATAMGKLELVNETLQKLTPECNQFITSPPTDPAKRDFEHKKLSEFLLAQVLLKTDAVEVEGDPEARAKRKELVKETQRIMNKLDESLHR